MILRATFPQVYELEHPYKGRYYLVSARSTKWGLNERKTFQQKELAIKHAKDIEAQILQFGKREDVQKEKVVLAERYERLAARVGTFGQSVEDAIEHYVRFKGDEVSKQVKPFVRELVDKWVEFKSADTTLSKRYLNEIANYARFIKRQWGDSKPDNIKRNETDLLFKKLDVSNNTRRKYLRYVRMFLSWVKDEGHIAKNPTDGIFYKPDDFNGDFYTPDETAKVLRYATEHHKDLIGHYALLAFAGLRPSEGERVQWRDFNFKTNELYVRKGKTNARHIILESVAVEWMKHHRENSHADSPFVELKNLTNREKKIHKAALDGKWFQDGLRHGFGTYYKALTQNIGKVADYMGNSADMVKRHYARTIEKDEWEKFWQLTPAVVLAKNP